MKRGFTLVEVLGVIVLIAVLALIVTPAISSVIMGGEDDAYKLQIESLKDSLRAYGAANSLRLPTDDNPISISIGCLKQNGFVDIEFKNPKTGECFCNENELLITKKQSSYLYSIETDPVKFKNSSTNCPNTSNTCEVVGNMTCPFQ